MEEIKKMETMEEIKKIENPTSRLRAYSRRRNNLIKKANRLIKECGVELAIVVISPSGHMSHFSSDHNMGSILERYINLPLEARYAHDPKLKEKQAILAQLEPIQGMENKSLYLDIQTSCLERQLHVSKIEQELTEATLRNFELDPCKDPSMEQLDWCEENLLRSLSRLAERKNELIMKELTMTYEPSSLFFRQGSSHDVKQVACERPSTSSILMQLDPWISPFSTKIRESILEEVKKDDKQGTKVPTINGVDFRSIPYRPENNLLAGSSPLQNLNISVRAGQAQSNSNYLPLPAQMYGLKMGASNDISGFPTMQSSGYPFAAMSSQSSNIVSPPHPLQKMLLSDSDLFGTRRRQQRLKTVHTDDQVFSHDMSGMKDQSKMRSERLNNILLTPVPASQKSNSDQSQEILASECAPSSNKGGKECESSDDEFVVPADFSWPDDTDFRP